MNKTLTIKCNTMLPVDFEGSNLVLNKPQDMTDEECMSIHAYKGVRDDGNPFIVTVWQPNKEDIEAINEGRPVCVSVISQSFAPMSVYTLDSKGEINE